MTADDSPEAPVISHGFWQRRPARQAGKVDVVDALRRE